MENLYIQIVDGAPVNHPALESNLIDALGSVPSNWAPFTRLAPTDFNVTLGVYQKYACTYILGSDGVTWQDSFSAVDMTADEISAKQTAYQNVWATHQFADNFTAWTFDAPTCTFVPPTPEPTDAPSGQHYVWQGSSNSWQLIPPAPSDGNYYIWNYDTWQYQVFNPTPSSS
jgi:hypothetical protein